MLEATAEFNCDFSMTATTAIYLIASSWGKLKAFQVLGGTCSCRCWFEHLKEGKDGMGKKEKSRRWFQQL